MSGAGSLVVILHGVGANGQDLAGLGLALQPALPGTRFASPDAPDAFGGGGPGHQWFSLTDVTPGNRPGRVAAARPGIDRVLGDAIARHGFSGRLGRVALVGFSQGATVALDAVASGRWPVAAVAALSGRLATAIPPGDAPRPPVLLVHGAEDTVVPPEESVAAAAALRRRGFAVETHRLAGVGHEVAPNAVRITAAFLAGIFGDLPVA